MAVWAVASAALPTIRRARARTRREVSGTRARISSTSKRRTKDKGNACDLTVDGEAPANDVLDLCAGKAGRLSSRNRDADPFRRQVYLQTSVFSRPSSVRRVTTGAG